MSERPKNNICITDFEIALSNVQARDRGPGGPGKRTIVRSGPLCVPQGSFSWEEDDGYGPTIWFDVPYKHTNGSLIVEFFHSGSGEERAFHVDALYSDNERGVWQELGDVEAAPETLRVAPTIKFITGHGGAALGRH